MILDIKRCRFCKRTRRSNISDYPEPCCSVLSSPKHCWGGEDEAVYRLARLMPIEQQFQRRMRAHQKQIYIHFSDLGILAIPLSGCGDLEDILEDLINTHETGDDDDDEVCTDECDLFYVDDCGSDKMCTSWTCEPVVGTSWDKSGCAPIEEKLKGGGAGQTHRIWA